MMFHSVVLRRLGGLFGIALLVIVFQAGRLKPFYRPVYNNVWEPGEQLFPIAVPDLEERYVPRPPASRHELLRRLSVFPANAQESECDLFVRISKNHWRRYAVSRQGLPPLLAEPALVRAGDALKLYLLGTDFLDDDDGDGFPLDRAELRLQGPGAEVEVFCQTLISDVP